jgi:hypothetical protein
MHSNYDSKNDSKNISDDESDSESLNEYLEYKLSMIESYDHLEVIDDHNYIINFYNFMKLYNCSFYKLLNRENNQFCSYVVIKTSFTELFKEIRSFRLLVGELDGELYECSIIDKTFYDQLYQSKNKSLSTSIAQLTIFKDDENIIKKCKNRTESYIIPKVAIELMDICTIIPQYSMFGYNIDSLFIIKTYNPNVPSICLEIYENNHNDRDQEYEKNREEVIKSLEYRLIRYPVKRHAHTNDDELNEYIKEIVEKIKIMVKDVTTDYSLSLSESDFMDKINRLGHIDRDFIRLFVKKDDQKYGKYKYDHTEIAQFLDYKNESDNACYNKGFVELIKKELKLNTDYIIDDGTTEVDFRGSNVERQIKKGVKLIYRITRIGFYIMCMVSSKPKARLYRRQFGEVYELAIDYTQQLKNNIVSSKQSVDTSKKALEKRVEYIVDLKNRRLSVKTDIEIERLNIIIRERDETINSLNKKYDKLMTSYQKNKQILKSLLQLDDTNTIINLTSNISSST